MYFVVNKTKSKYFSVNIQPNANNSYGKKSNQSIYLLLLHSSRVKDRKMANVPQSVQMHSDDTFSHKRSEEHH